MPLWISVRSRTDEKDASAHASLMFCRIEVLKGEAKRVIHTRYESADEFADIELVAERHRRTHHGDGFRVHDLHTDQVTERLNLGS